MSLTLEQRIKRLELKKERLTNQLKACVKEIDKLKNLQRKGAAWKNVVITALETCFEQLTPETVPSEEVAKAMVEALITKSVSVNQKVDKLKSEKPESEAPTPEEKLEPEEKEKRKSDEPVGKANEQKIVEKNMKGKEPDTPEGDDREINTSLGREPISETVPVKEQKLDTQIANRQLREGKPDDSPKGSFWNKQPRWEAPDAF